MKKLHPAVEKAWLYWVCVLIVIAMFTDFVIRVITTGLLIASGWWLVKTVTRWLLPWRRRRDVAYTVASDTAKEVTPTHTVFR